MGSVTKDSGEITSLPSNINTILIKPLIWLADIPRESSRTIDIAIEGRLHFMVPLYANLNNDLWQDPSGINIEVSSDRISIPGIFSILIRADENAQPGIYAIPIEFKARDFIQTVWLFARISVPFGGSTIEPAPYPPTSRIIGIHTDSQLREEEDNILVIKGELGSLLGGTAGTSIVVKLDLGNEQIIEQKDTVANSNYYSTSLVLPPLERDTVVKGRVTWLGSSTSPGGISPIIYLPVGGYSISSGTRKQDFGPEPALFVLGATPAQVTTNQDLFNILDDATNTLLSEFNSVERNVLTGKSEIETTINGFGDLSTFLLYAVADTSSGAIKLNDQETLSPEELSNIFSSINNQSNIILIIEGPKSGAFASSTISYPSGITIIASCSVNDQNNEMSPWTSSFSAGFFEGCRRSLSVADSFNLAELTFLDFLVGQTQTPQFIRGNAAEIQLNGRFVPALLQDDIPPEILGFSYKITEEENIEFNVTVADNRDNYTDIQVGITSISIENEILGEIELSPETGGNSHSGTLPDIINPGLLIIVDAMDSSGNVSLSKYFWISTTDSNLLYDMNDDDIVNQDDLLFLMEMKNLGITSNHWLFDFGIHWLNSQN